MNAANADIADLYVIVQGPPRKDSLDGRLTIVETSHAAAAAAESALIVAKELRDDRTQRKWTTREKLTALVLSSLAILSPWAMAIYYGKPH
jgi:hypothetical protein